MNESIETPVTAELPAPALYELPRISRGSAPIPEAWDRAMKDAETARARFQAGCYQEAAELYRAIARALTEAAAGGVYTGELASARDIANENAELALRQITKPERPHDTCR